MLRQLCRLDFRCIYRFAAERNLGDDVTPIARMQRTVLLADVAGRRFWPISGVRYVLTELAECRLFRMCQSRATGFGNDPIASAEK